MIVIVWIILCCHMEFNFFKKNFKKTPFQCCLFYNRNFPFLHPSTSRRILFSVFNPSWKVTVVLQERPPSLSCPSWMLWIGLCFSGAEIHWWEGALGAAEYCLPPLEVKCVPLGAAEIVGGEGWATPPVLLALTLQHSASWPPFQCTALLI